MPMGFFDWLGRWWRNLKRPVPPIASPPRPTTQPPVRTTIAPAAPPQPLPEPPAAVAATPVIVPSDFLPIPREELHEQAKDVRRGGAWFGRRDLIPPADDPRT